MLKFWIQGEMQVATSSYDRHTYTCPFSLSVDLFTNARCMSAYWPEKTMDAPKFAWQAVSLSYVALRIPKP